MGSWNAGWEIEFPAKTNHELLLALVVRDLIHGTSFDVESEEDGVEFAVDYTAGDELEGDVYRLLLAVEVEGPEKPELVGAFTEQALEELLEEAEDLVGKSTDLGSISSSDLVFEIVPEDEERWDYVVPDWLAPDGAEVPFGFRSFVSSAGKPFPDDATLDANGRVIAVPWDDEIRLVAIPAPAHYEDQADSAESV
jgi:hypothetical protein